ncbi:MAG: DnaD domain protein [Syntrophomonas sp.]|uniref:DnaD domain-containing protein n=1 Tax=Syntrophomonas sp. TaxID=2053627 RepID=UPI002635888A|nr:DnaD domain protein [Syntrophomonas sp.]MDD2511062.1 DnaD domain protein [Syntrophomonas sp.]MDD3879329.1 DnaD domain protein [Syntrophomonas sp.]MDD4626386.1 DnaD domain protein [Syntrophomonas sp.]
MEKRTAWLEIFRWGFVNFPGMLFAYARELDIELEDIAIIAALLYTMERTKPLYQTGIKVGQVLQACPSLGKMKISRRLNRLQKLGIVALQSNQNLAEREVFLDPLAEKLESLIRRDHSDFCLPSPAENPSHSKEVENLLGEYRTKIEQLELQIEENKLVSRELIKQSSSDFKKVGDFIAKKTGNLMSVKMAGELNKWLEELALSPEFLLCILEMCFERSIYNPRDISQIARDIKEYSINTVEGLESYFKKYVDVERSRVLRVNKFDPDIAEFGSFTGIDMAAEARKKVYYKWRHDWGFSHAMIMKAGEVMCKRTKNAGLEYMDSVLHDWMSKEIRQVEEVDKEIAQLKLRNKKEKSIAASSYDKRKPVNLEYEIYVPPSTTGGAKNKV